MLKTVFSLIFLFVITHLSAAGVMGNPNTYLYIDGVDFPETAFSEDVFYDEEEGDFFQIDGFYDWLSDAKFENGIARGDKLSFDNGRINLSYVAFLSTYDAISFGAGYEETRLEWQKNPFFEKTQFHTVDIAIGWLSKNFVEWTWKALAVAEVDANHFDLANYTRYSLTLWGRYALPSSWVDCFGINDFGINFGSIGYTGLKKNDLIPLVGVDFKVNTRWTCSFVYPVAIAVVYEAGKYWSWVIAARFWNLRHRVSGGEPFPKSIWQYRNRGLEFAINWDYDPIVSFNVHVGGTLGDGELRIHANNNNNGSKFHVESSFYAGASAFVRF